MLVRRQEDGLNDFVAKCGMIETATCIIYIVVGYVQDDVKLPRETEWAFPFYDDDEIPSYRRICVEQVTDLVLLSKLIVTLAFACCFTSTPSAYDP